MWGGGVIFELVRSGVLFECVLYFISVAISMCCNPDEKPCIGCLNAAMGRNLHEGEKRKSFHEDVFF